MHEFVLPELNRQSHVDYFNTFAARAILSELTLRARKFFSNNTVGYDSSFFYDLDL